MPFYLVTQTSLVEGDDEQDAAQKAIDRIRSGAQIAVSVKFDEMTVSDVIVPAKTGLGCPVTKIAAPDTNQARSLPTQDDPLSKVGKRLILKRMLADALLLVK